jgi:hypothetical protein
MIVISHPRSGSSAFCRMLHYALNPTYKGGVGTRLSEFLNFGSNGDGNNNGWHFNTFPIIQHFIIGKNKEPFLWNLNVLDQGVYDIPVDENWQDGINEYLAGRWKSPMVKKEILFTKDNWRGIISDQIRARVRYIDHLQNNQIPFTCKHFLLNGTSHFIDKGSKYYEIGLTEPDRQTGIKKYPPLLDHCFDFRKYDHIFLLATNPARSVMSGALLNNYKLKAKAHNYEAAEYEPLVPEINPPEIRPVQLQNRLGAILALYHELRHGCKDSTVITNTQLFKDNAVSHKGKTISFDEYAEKDSYKEIPIPYANPIEDYHSNSAEIVKQVKNIVTSRYPDIVDKYGITFE